MFSRTLPALPGEERPPVAVFGVTGALYAGNVLFYDRTEHGLWSQLAGGAVSGPRAGRRLESLPFRMVRMDRLVERAPDTWVAQPPPGSPMPYGSDPYAPYFADPERLLVPVRGIGAALPPKTLGLGVRSPDGRAWFVAADAARGPDGYVLDTPDGAVRFRTTLAGIQVLTAPRGYFTAQTYYYAWSVFHPHAEVATSLVGSPPPSAEQSAGAEDESGAERGS